MEEKNFWREKNVIRVAENNPDKYEIIVPKKEVLIEEIKRKFVQKLSYVDFIFDECKRNQYLSEKYKKEKGYDDVQIQEKIASLGDTSFERQQNFGKRVVVDLFQLVMDMCDVLKIDYQTLQVAESTTTAKEICLRLQMNVDKLFKDEILKGVLRNIKQITLNLAMHLKLDLDEVEKLRSEIEEKEGNFAKGKILVEK